MRVDAGRGIVAEVAMNVDDAGGQIFSGAVIDRDVGRDWRLGAADGLDLAIRQQHGAIVDPPAFAVENRDVTHRRHLLWIGLIGRRIGVLVELRRLFGRSDEPTSELQSLMRISYDVY